MGIANQIEIYLASKNVHLRKTSLRKLITKKYSLNNINIALNDPNKQSL